MESSARVSCGRPSVLHFMCPPPDVCPDVCSHRVTGHSRPQGPARQPRCSQPPPRRVLRMSPVSARTAPARRAERPTWARELGEPSRARAANGRGGRPSPCSASTASATGSPTPSGPLGPNPATPTLNSGRRDAPLGRPSSGSRPASALTASSVSATIPDQPTDQPTTKPARTSGPRPARLDERERVGREREAR
jgi:hypothetical protein